ncbi:MAG: hypothetical protein FJ290_08895 [Planctomycetes bacterium]|nr:hypothetical protein [Planctomycetota bacterium]
MSSERPHTAKGKRQDVDKQELLNALMRVQEELRNRLSEDLREEDEPLEEIFSPTSFSNKFEQYRYKYTERLDTLNRIIAEVQRSEGGRPTFKAMSVEAGSREDLLTLINQRLAKTRPAMVADLKIYRERPDSWVALLICGF